MCELKSGLLFKNGVFVPDYDGHDKMLKEKGIADTAENRVRGEFVRFELSPKNGDPFSSVKDWVFTIDQDELPDWIQVDTAKYESMARDAVTEWVSKRIFVGIDGLNITEGIGYYLKDCKNVTLSGNASVHDIRDNSTVRTMRGNSTVRTMRDNSTVLNMWDNSTVQDMLGNSTVRTMRDNSMVQDMWGDSMVQDMWDNSTVRTMRGNSTVRSMRDNSTVQNMWNNSTVQNMWDNSTVQNMWDNSTVWNMRGNSTVLDMWDNSTVLNMRDNSTVQNMWNNSTVRIVEYESDGINVKTIHLSQNATIKDCRTKTLYVSGDWKMMKGCVS